MKHEYIFSVRKKCFKSLKISLLSWSNTTTFRDIFFELILVFLLLVQRLVGAAQRVVFGITSGILGLLEQKMFEKFSLELWYYIPSRHCILKAVQIRNSFKELKIWTCSDGMGLFRILKGSVFEWLGLALTIYVTPLPVFPV